MKEKKIIQFRLTNGCMVVVLVDSRKWFVEYPTKELPEEVKNCITENIDDAEILKKIVM